MFSPWRGSQANRWGSVFTLGGGERGSEDPHGNLWHLGGTQGVIRVQVGALRGPKGGGGGHRGRSRGHPGDIGLGGGGAPLTEINRVGGDQVPKAPPPPKRHRFDVDAAPQRNGSHMAGGHRGADKGRTDGRTAVGGVERWSRRSRGSMLGGPPPPHPVSLWAGAAPAVAAGIYSRGRGIITGGGRKRPGRGQRSAPP